METGKEENAQAILFEVWVEMVVIKGIKIGESLSVSSRACLIDENFAATFDDCGMVFGQLELGDYVLECVN